MRLFSSKARAKALEQSVIEAVRNGPISGYEVSQFTDINPGSVYQILHRLEEAGRIESEWEDIDPDIAGRPPRKLYSTGAAK